MRVWIKRIGVICLIPIALVLLLSILLYIPPFQNFAVRKATEYAGKVTGMQIGIEQIRLSFPLDLTVKGVEVVNPGLGALKPPRRYLVEFTELDGTGSCPSSFAEASIGRGDRPPERKG